MRGVIYLNDKSQKQETIPIGETKVVKKRETITPQKLSIPINMITNNLSLSVQKYINDFQDAIRVKSEIRSAPILTDELAIKVGRIYESARRIIDWKEEHVVRRTAIQRILKRRLVSEISGIGILPGANAEQMAEPLVLELIRGGYFANGSIPNTKILQVQEILEKYIFILKNNPLVKNGNALSIKEKVQFFHWILEIGACELEEALDTPLKETALLNLMTECLYERIQIIPENKMSEKEKFLQVYIAVQRTLLNLDDPYIRYLLLKQKYPQVIEGDEQAINDLVANISDIRKEIENDLNYAHAGEFFKIAEKYDAAYLILGNVMEEVSNSPNNIPEKIAKETALVNIIETVYNKRLSTLKGRLFRSAIYSTLSIFLAGSISLFIIEIPLAKLVYGKFSYLAMFVDIALPTLFMFVLVSLIKPPPKSNLQKIKEEINKIVYKSDEIEIYEIKLAKKTKFIRDLIFTIFYLVGGFASLFFIYWVFKVGDVPWTSLYIDTVNVAVVVFAAVLIKEKSKEITIEEEGTFIGFILDFFSIPLAKLGLWFSNKIKEYNIVSVFFTTLIDTPFSTFIAGLEDWRNFIKTKRTEIH